MLWDTVPVGRCFSPDSPISNNNKTDRHFVSQVLLKVSLNIHIRFADDTTLCDKICQ
jgi:hypothetical protein